MFTNVVKRGNKPRAKTDLFLRSLKEMLKLRRKKMKKRTSHLIRMRQNAKLLSKER